MDTSFSFSDAVQKFQNLLEFRNLAHSTQENYLKWLKRFFQWVDADSPSLLLPSHAFDFILHLHTDCRYSDSYINQASASLRLFYPAILDIQVTGQQIPIRHVRRKPARWFSHEEVLRILDSCRDHDPLLFTCIALAYECGLRASEVVNIQLGDIDPVRSTIYIRGSKRNKSRLVHYSPALRQILNSYCASQRLTRSGYSSDSFIFHAKRPDVPYNRGTISRRFKDHIRALGYQEGFCFHSLRHSYATTLALRNVSIFAIKTSMGHKSVQTTENYIHLPSDLHLTWSTPLSEEETSPLNGDMVNKDGR